MSVAVEVLEAIGVHLLVDDIEPDVVRTVYVRHTAEEQMPALVDHDGHSVAPSEHHKEFQGVDVEHRSLRRFAQHQILPGLSMERIGAPVRANATVM